MAFPMKIGALDVSLFREETRRPESGHGRDRFYDNILDSCWRIEVDILKLDPRMEKFCPSSKTTSILIAGKAAGPDHDALRLARQVLGSPFTALAPLLEKFPQFPFSSDEWMLTSIWFPYQTYRQCWFVSCVTEYDGTCDFVFIPGTGDAVCGTEIENLHYFADSSNEAGYCQDSFASVPGIITNCIEALHHRKISNAGFNEILTRIEEERIFGTEIVAPLLSVVEEIHAELPSWQYEHLTKRLRRSRDAIALK